MNGDFNPSVVCGMFCTPTAYERFKLLVDNRFGMRVREIRFIDISIPLDDNFEKAVNHLKHFSNPMLYGLLKNIPLKKLVFYQLKRKMNLVPFDYSQIWETDNRHPLILTGLTPLFVDVKYKEKYNKKEQENLDKLTRFETKNYKPIIDSKKPEDMKLCLDL